MCACYQLGMQGAGEFTPAHALVQADGASPERWLVILHGIFGSGANWRMLARRLCEARPAWGACLVDLRGHGGSIGAPPPHTLDAAADDVLRLEERLGLAVEGIAGHSFGGKVALAWLARRRRRARRALLLDSSLGLRQGVPNADAVLELLRRVPQPLPSRERFVELVRAAGHSKAIADWLAMHVRRAPDGYRLRLDLDAIGALLADYAGRDLWDVALGPVGTDELDVVVGGRSDVVSPADRERFAAACAANPRVRLHELAGAGHWLHADDPDGLIAVMTGALA